MSEPYNVDDALQRAARRIEREMGEMQRLRDALAAAERDKLAWQQAAHVVGECIATTGPAGYYDMEPADWRDWLIADVKGQLAALGRALPDDTTTEGMASAHVCGVQGFDAWQGDVCDGCAAELPDTAAPRREEE